MKKHIKIIIAAITLAAMLPLMMIPASANSALTQWGGKDANGIVTTNKDCPIIVEHEKLTFNISEFPDEDEVDHLVIANSTVTAEYTFYNPSDMTVNAKLAFPFGVMNDRYNAGEYNKHDITVNGERIDAEIRHTLYTSNSFGEYKFIVNEDLPRLLDHYAKNDTFNEETTVTKYSIDLSTVEKAYWWKLDIDPDEYPDSLIYIPKASHTDIKENGDLTVTGIINGTSESIDVYVFGEANSVSGFKFYPHSLYSSGKSPDEEIKGSSTLKGTEEISFMDFVFEYYDEESGISRMDWYNATIHRIERLDTKYSYLYFARFDTDYHDSFMSWYYYEITVGAKDRIINSVTAPMIPGINISYNPPKYDYTYLISPAATWSDFGKLDIYINTPYYLIYSNIDGFEKTENGYELHLDGLPREKDSYHLTLDGLIKEEGKVKDLSFKLCSAENPESKRSLPVWATVLIIIGLIILLPVILVGAVVYGIVMGVSYLINVFKK